MAEYSVRICTRPQDCRKLWALFSPQKSLFDCWEYRYPFYEAFRFPLHFVLLCDGDQEVGLLPLWQNPGKGNYLWFGDCDDGVNWSEDNGFWVRDEKYLSPLLENCPRPLVLNSIAAHQDLPKGGGLIYGKGDSKHILTLEDMRAPEDFLSRLDAKFRQNLRRDFRRIESLHPTIEVDRFEDFDELIWNNLQRSEKSYFRDEKLVNALRGVIKNGQNGDCFQSRMLSVRINGKIAGIDLIFTHRQVYYPMLCGNRVEDFPGIGNYMNFLDIKDALELNMRKIDFSESEEHTYKDKWFQSVETRRLILS